MRTGVVFAVVSVPLMQPRRELFTLRASIPVGPRFRPTMLGVAVPIATFARRRRMSGDHLLMEPFHPLAEFLHLFRIERRSPVPAASLHLLAELLHPLVHFFHALGVEMGSRPNVEAGPSPGPGRHRPAIAVGSRLIATRFVPLGFVPPFRFFSRRRFPTRFRLFRVAVGGEKHHADPSAGGKNQSRERTNHAEPPRCGRCRCVELRYSTRRGSRSIATISDLQSSPPGLPRKHHNAGNRRFPRSAKLPHLIDHERSSRFVGIGKNTPQRNEMFTAPPRRNPAG
jgi:hypothetical protein